MQKKSAKVFTGAVIALILSLTIFFAGICRTETQAVDSQGRAVGVDVSSYNGTIDWEKAKANGVDFAIIRIGFGDDDPKQDDTFAVTNMEGCEDAGIPYGVYIYSYAITEKEVDSEVSHTLRMIEGHDPELGIWFDMEDADGYKKDRHAFNPYTHGKELTNFCLRFVEAMKEKGFENVGVYSNWDYYHNVLDYDLLSNAGLIWLAHWGISSPSMECAMWQYSEQGKVTGIPSARVDMDMIYSGSPLYGLIVSDEPVEQGTPAAPLVMSDGKSICRGDVNGDNAIDVIDLALVKKHVLKKSVLQGDAFTLGDVNNDGTVDVIDLAQVKKHILGKIDLLAQAQQETTEDSETTTDTETKAEPETTADSETTTDPETKADSATSTDPETSSAEAADSETTTTGTGE